MSNTSQTLHLNTYIISTHKMVILLLSNWNDIFFFLEKLISLLVQFPLENIIKQRKSVTNS